MVSKIFASLLGNIRLGLILFVHKTTVAIFLEKIELISISQNLIDKLKKPKKKKIGQY